MVALASLPFLEHSADYLQRMAEALNACDWSHVASLYQELVACRAVGRQVFLVGNGGSAANAVHIANDMLCLCGLRAHALSANTAVLTCLGNDQGHDAIFADQLHVLASDGDLLIVLSGSGNSANVLAALREARIIGMRTYAVLGYDAGQARDLADVPIHLPVSDMQIAEDFQLMVGHVLMQWLRK